MKNQHTESLQNQFSAYLVAAVTNKRIRYMEKRRRQNIRETNLLNMELKNYLDFEEQYNNFRKEQTDFVMKDWEKYQDFMELLESDKLRIALGRLKERESRILLARVFGELTFEQIGERFEMKPKQAEMSFYYILRKLRKELEVSKRDEF